MFDAPPETRIRVMEANQRVTPLPSWLLRPPRDRRDLLRQREAWAAMAEVSTAVAPAE